jgi:hypothetical protein
VRSLRRGTSTLDFEEFEKLGHLDAPTPNRVASPWQSDCRQREQEERRSEGCSSAASLEGGLSSRQPALPAHGFSAHAACSLVRAVRTSYPRGHKVGPRRWRCGDCRILTTQPGDLSSESKPTQRISRDHLLLVVPGRRRKRVAGHRALSNNIKATSEPSEERLKAQ